MANYRITITGATATAQDRIAFPCTIEKEVSGAWQPLAGAPGTIYLSTADVIGILRTEVLEADQRLELLAALRTNVRSLSIVQTDAAIDRLEALLPSGWPVTVNL